MTRPGDSDNRTDFAESLPDVDPLTAPTGDLFVVQQHYATALHHDFRLEMLNVEGPVLVSWAVPKGLPRRRGQRHLAIRTPDHSMEHATFSGSIPGDEYGGGEVRIFDHGGYEMVERSDDRLTFRLQGERLVGIWHLVSTGTKDGKEQWLAMMREDLREPGDNRPPLEPMLATPGEAPNDPAWGFEPEWDGIRALAVCGEGIEFESSGRDVTADHADLKGMNRHVIALDAILDGVIVSATYVAFDLIWIDGRDLTREPYEERRRLLEEAVVPSPRIQVSPMTEGTGSALLQAAEEQGLPGIVAKRLASTYQPGLRSPDWLLRRVQAT